MYEAVTLKSRPVIITNEAPNGKPRWLGVTGKCIACWMEDQTGSPGDAHLRRRVYIYTGRKLEQEVGAGGGWVGSEMGVCLQASLDPAHISIIHCGSGEYHATSIDYATWRLVGGSKDRIIGRWISTLGHDLNTIDIIKETARHRRPRLRIHKSL